MNCVISCNIKYDNFFTYRISPVGQKLSVEKEISAIRECSIGKFAKHALLSRGKAIVSLPFSVIASGFFGTATLLGGMATLGTLVCYPRCPKPAKKCSKWTINCGKKCFNIGLISLAAPIAILTPELTTKVFRTDNLYRKNFSSTEIKKMERQWEKLFKQQELPYEAKWDKKKCKLILTRVPPPSSNLEERQYH